MRTQAEESRRADALFHDPVAHLVAGGARSMGDWIMVPRTRYGDDLIEELGKTGASQLVLLGAGMDTRAFRLASLRAWTVFEVDLQETFAVKEPLLADQPTLCAQRVVLGADFAQASAVELVQLLVDAGFKREAPAVFLLEGLLMYLDEATTSRVIQAVRTVSAPGSVVFHDAITASYLQQGIAVHGAPFIGGSDDYAALWGAEFDTKVLDMARSVRVDRANRRLVVDLSSTQALVTPARAKGNNIVLFVHCRRK